MHYRNMLQAFGSGRGSAQVCVKRQHLVSKRDSPESSRVCSNEVLAVLARQTKSPLLATPIRSVEIARVLTIVHNPPSHHVRLACTILHGESGGPLRPTLPQTGSNQIRPRAFCNKQQTQERIMLCSSRSATLTAAGHDPQTPHRPAHEHTGS